MVNGNPFQRLTSTAADQPPKQGEQGTGQQSSPIIVVTGEDQWTIASDDTEALDLFSRLVDTFMSPKVSPIATAGNYSIYILHHADAKHLQELLVELFGSGSNRRSSIGDAMQRVKIVADPRINGLVIGGNRSDRKIVEELLAVFDSKDLLDTIQEISPTIVQLRNASAKNVVDVLKEVYKSQLKTGAGRDPITIPKGFLRGRDSLATDQRTVGWSSFNRSHRRHHQRPSCCVAPRC